MAQNPQAAESALEIDRLATQLAKDPHSKVFMPLAEEYGKVGMWQEAAGVLEDGLKLYPGFITAMVALGRAYDQMGQATKAKAILEESVKVSPENLRAHRTLIKIYQSQGLKESALRSCAVILAVNPRDEEALSVQAVLGGPLTQKSEPGRSKPADPVTVTPSAQEMSTVPDPSATTADERETVSLNDSNLSTNVKETALIQEDRIGGQLVALEQGFSSVDSEMAPAQSPHAGAVAQLEAWLRAIELRRHDRDETSDPQTKTS
jgi:tetratricopeptide (TPR) repeat protein